jgi:hypothetical protein
VLAKGLITALVTRLFIINKEKLLLIKWFASFYYWFTEKKEWLYSEVRQLPGWQAAREWIARLKVRLRLLDNSIRSVRLQSLSRNKAFGEKINVT